MSALGKMMLDTRSWMLDGKNSGIMELHDCRGRPPCLPRYSRYNCSRNKMRKLYLIILICLFTGVACGYKFTGGGELPSGIKSINIELFENRTSETGLEHVITNDLNYEVTRNGRVSLTDKESSDAVLTGTIRSLNVDSISHKGKSSIERRVKITVDMKLTSSAGKVLWSVQGVTEDEDYDVMDDKPDTEQNRSDAIEELSKRLAEKIYNRMADDF